MDRLSSVFAALREEPAKNERKTPAQIRRPAKNEAKKKMCANEGCGHSYPEGAKFCPECGAPVGAPAVEEEDTGLTTCTCGYELMGDEAFCPGCGAPLSANEEDDDDIPPNDVIPEDDDVEIVIDDESGEEPEDPDANEEEIPEECLPDVPPEDTEEPEDDDELVLSAYNEDMIKYMGRCLKKVGAPTPVQKAFESKMYNRCATWLERKKGIKVDLTEGFSASEAKKIKAHLAKVQAPKSVCEAFDRGQYTLVSNYLKATRKK